MRRRTVAKIWVGFALAAGALLAVPSDARTVALPMVLGLLVAVTFVVILSDRSEVAPIAEIGLWFTGAVAVYTVIPLALYLIVGQEYGPLSENRLWAIQPAPAEVAQVGWLYVVFLTSFVCSYLAVRGRAEPPRVGLGVVNRQTLGVMIGFWIVLQIIGFVFIPRLSIGSYASGYAVLTTLPLAIRQVIRMSQAWSFVLMLGLRVWLFQDFRRRKWIIAAWIIYDLASAIITPGARTSIVLSLGSSLLLYHLFVRPIRMRTAVIAGCICIVGFQALGFVRSLQALNTVSTGQTGGEFESLFANAVDLRHRVASGEIGSLPISFHLADLFTALPSQVLPFTKQDPSAWYAQTFYPKYAESGGGFAFGVIAQGIVGFGWVELVVRGSILGVVFAAFHRFFSRHADRFWLVVLYVWATVWAYQSFRNQSFILLGSMVEEFLPTVVLVEAMRIMLRAARPSQGSDNVLPALR